ncbi:MAG: hypothetical protein C4321_09275 [Chloroflexota bacterium]
MDVAKLQIRGRSGYILRPSRLNPQVKRWQKAGEEQPLQSPRMTGERASLRAREELPQSPRATRGRASVALPDALKHPTEWVSLAASQRFKDRFGLSLGSNYLRGLEQAANSPFLGWHERDYKFGNWYGEPGLPVDKSALVGEITSSDPPEYDEGFWRALGVRHPDQYLARMLGVSLPVIAEMVDPENSNIEIYPGPELYIATDLRNSDGDLVLSHRRTFNGDWGIWDYVRGRRRDRPRLGTLYNDYLSLGYRLQGLGLANPMYAAQTAYARDLGIDEIQLTANAEVGGYNWPLLGYDFLTEADREEVLRNFDAHLKNAVALGLLSERSAKRYWNSLDKLAPAWDYARAEISPRVGRESERHPTWRRIGKHAMLGASYEAVRDLKDQTAYEVATDTIKRRLKKVGIDVA